MEYLTLEKVSMTIGQMQLSILNLQSHVEKLEEELKDFRNQENKQEN